MKRILKISVSIILLAVAGLVCYLKFMLPNVGAAEDVHVDATAQRVARGQYLANHVTVCMDCHSKRDWQHYAGPLIPSTFGGGGEVFNQDLGFPGVFYSRNITPYGIGKWTDGEIIRAITCGVSRDGSALFPVMPYHYYGQLDREDIYSIVAYLRSLPAVKNDVPKSKADFPVSLLMNTMPTKASFSKRPDTSDVLAYGAYLAKAAACVECHTKDDRGQIIKGLEYGGGRVFKLPKFIVRSANITADPETGIGNWSKEAFIKRFKMYADSSYNPALLAENDPNTIMPWLMYAGMKESDLGAIYEYLRTVPVIKSSVTKFEKRTM